MHDGNPDFTRQPTPRHEPAMLARIKREDAKLRNILEDLVPNLDREYERFGNDFWTFLDDHMIPVVHKVLKRLAKEDKTEYAAGRRELGVVMQYIDESEDEPESETSEVEVEEDDESDEDY
ncbi:hypothetical protein ACN47E_004082 [Coniothyrium glycines]